MTFKYSGLKGTGDPRDAATVTFTVKDTGMRPGADIAQVDVGSPASAGEPPRRLKRYRRVQLD